MDRFENRLPLKGLKKVISSTVLAGQWARKDVDVGDVLCISRIIDTFEKSVPSAKTIMLIWVKSGQILSEALHT